MLVHSTYGYHPNIAPIPIPIPSPPLLELARLRLDCHQTRAALFDLSDAARLRARDVPARLEPEAARRDMIRSRQERINLCKIVSSALRGVFEALGGRGEGT